ncbi:MAG: methylated-DNA--[protein]-cysteine S-methyltransferase [Symbiobacteriaceae bacterium]|jgi:methylated-DNA-[protein]-cysteine S-methyltransferase|nr:methylated-DNA--[protein]-cysteine S-methyltransferase [Symbiobacteriaceae bacterium]
MPIIIARVPTAGGDFGAVVTPAGLARLTFPDEPMGLCHAWARRWEPTAELTDNGPALAPVAEQLAAYFDRTLQVFDLPLDLRGTPFQQEVWQALTAIPFGATCSYAHIALQIGRPKAVRAVGAANGANPVPIIVPCHRVIGSNGKLTGYAGGLGLKQRLLELEGRFA